MTSVEFLPRIPEEFAGKHVFVTGGSGFMGKVLIEKLLRSCPDVACVHVLVRPKKGVDVQARLQAILDTPLFEPLLKADPGGVAKLRAVAGDCSELGLGLSAADEAVLAANVSYVFHAAASVRFDEPLKEAVLLNVRGTREVVELCKKMKNLKALEYVSTTYCFTKETVLKEQHYEANADWRVMIRLAETESKETLDALSSKILDWQPNTYTFTKALAENIINDVRNDIPVIIYRPAVVVSTLREPFPGWLDNLNGPFGVWAGALKGVLRFSYGNPDVALSFTPVDWAIRGMIVCAVAKGLKSAALSSKDHQEVDVVNMEGSKYDRNTFRYQAENMHEWYHLVTNPVRYPGYHIGTSYAHFWLGTVLSELPYGLAIDTLLRVVGQKPRMLAIYRKIVTANLALAVFMLNEFPVETEKMVALHQATLPEDRASFGMALDDEESGMTYDREKYLPILVKGAFRYALKETATEEETRRKLKKLFVLEIVLKALWTYVMYIAVGRPILTRVLPLW